MKFEKHELARRVFVSWLKLSQTKFLYAYKEVKSALLKALYYIWTLCNVHHIVSEDNR